ncbi:MAG: hypothetical protein JW829_21430 [Pirellulales bacterium]|nr:hypothetical protein [Pirellulales bacterium]
MPPETPETIAARFERFQKLADLVRLIVNLFGILDWSKLQPLFEAIAKLRAIEQTPGTADDKERIKAALEVAQILVEITPNELDDKLAAAISTLLGNEAILEIFARLLDNLANRTDTFVASTMPRSMLMDAGGLSEAEIEAIDKAGINLPALLALIQLILDLIAQFRGE